MLFPGHHIESLVTVTGKKKKWKHYHKSAEGNHRAFSIESPSRYNCEGRKQGEKGKGEEVRSKQRLTTVGLGNKNGERTNR